MIRSQAGPQLVNAYGEAIGRPLLAAVIAAGGRVDLSALKAYDDVRLYAVAWWLRAAAWKYALSTSTDPSGLEPDLMPDDNWIQNYRGFMLAHEYMHADRDMPSAICCRRCLVLMTGSLATITGALAVRAAGSKAAAALHVRTGLPMPFPGTS